MVFTTVTDRSGGDTNLLFKKPWTLSSKAEFMLGVGPEWVYLRRHGATSNSISGEIAGDFMFWPNGKHRFGWYLEPAYDYNFMAGHNLRGSSPHQSEHPTDLLRRPAADT